MQNIIITCFIRESFFTIRGIRVRTESYLSSRGKYGSRESDAQEILLPLLRRIQSFIKTKECSFFCCCQTFPSFGRFTSFQLGNNVSCLDLKKQNKQNPLLNFVCLCLFYFLGPNLQHMEAPRLGIKSELQLLATDMGCVCNLHHSSWQCWIFN